MLVVSNDWAASGDGKVFFYAGKTKDEAVKYILNGNIVDMVIDYKLLPKNAKTSRLRKEIECSYNAFGIDGNTVKLEKAIRDYYKYYLEWRGQAIIVETSYDKKIFDDIFKKSSNGKKNKKRLINYNVNLNAINQNKNIKAHILSDQMMREIGFTDYDSKNWYFFKSIADNITFNVSIKKKTGYIRIEVLDENIMQPYQYQELLRNCPHAEFALKVHEAVQEQMKYLMDKGIITGYRLGDYI